MVEGRQRDQLGVQEWLEQHQEPGGQEPGRQHAEQQHPAAPAHRQHRTPDQQGRAQDLADGHQHVDEAHGERVQPTQQVGLEAEHRVLEQPGHHGQDHEHRARHGEAQHVAGGPGDPVGIGGDHDGDGSSGHPASVSGRR